MHICGVGHCDKRLHIGDMNCVVVPHLVHRMGVPRFTMPHKRVTLMWPRFSSKRMLKLMQPTRCAAIVCAGLMNGCIIEACSVGSEAHLVQTENLPCQ